MLFDICARINNIQKLFNSDFFAEMRETTEYVHNEQGAAS